MISNHAEDLQWSTSSTPVSAPLRILQACNAVFPRFFLDGPSAMMNNFGQVACVTFLSPIVR